MIIHREIKLGAQVHLAHVSAMTGAIIILDVDNSGRACGKGCGLAQFPIVFSDLQEISQCQHGSSTREKRQWTRHHKADKTCENILHMTCPNQRFGLKVTGVWGQFAARCDRFYGDESMGSASSAARIRAIVSPSVRFRDAAEKPNACSFCPCATGLEQEA